MANIIIENLTKVYGSGDSRIVALDGISFCANTGGLTVVLGASGSGKSTLLNILGGMDNPTSGSVSVGGKEITRFNDRELTQYRRCDVGFVFQFYNLMPNLTALENVQICQSGNLSAQNALALVGLENRLHNFPSQLSGGEQQRVSIARAIVKNPKLLLCDEPTGALDTKTGRNIIILLQQLSKENDRSVVVVTHNTRLALAADRVIRLSDGKITKDEHNNAISAEDIDFE